MSKHERTKGNKKKIIYVAIPIIILIIAISIVVYKFNIIHKIVVAINPITITELKIELPKNEIAIGEEIEVKIDITPKDYTQSDLKWHSSNPDIIEINDGNVVGKSIGKATIYLTDNETKSNEIEVECLVKVESVSIENKITELKIGDTYKLQTKIVPENATYSELQFESMNSDVLTVDNSGNLKANALGKSKINVKNYKNEILDTVDIEVKKIPVNKIEIDDTEVKLGKGQTYILSVKVTPNEATYKDVIWESSNKSIITIEDRKVKATGVGTATITAITDNEDKKVSCTFKVTSTNPTNTKKYANGSYSIKTGKSTDYKTIATTKKYEAIEFLQDTKNGWKKVRNSEGVVGYTLVKSGQYLDERPYPENTATSHYIKDVPYINQFSEGYPTGCEAVSATMVLKYKKYNVSVSNIVNSTKNGAPKHQKEDGKWYGANPFEQFVGDPSKKLADGSYGVFAKPIVSAMNVYAGGKAKNISGCSENTLFNYVSKDNPVVVWCVKNAGDITNGVVWNYESGSGSFQELVGEHCAVLIGYDEKYVYLNDPSAGKNSKQSRSKFISNWKKLHSQAIVVE